MIVIPHSATKLQATRRWGINPTRTTTRNELTCHRLRSDWDHRFLPLMEEISSKRRYRGDTKMATRELLLTFENISREIYTALRPSSLVILDIVTRKSTHVELQNSTDDVSDIIFYFARNSKSRHPATSYVRSRARK